MGLDSWGGCSGLCVGSGGMADEGSGGGTELAELGSLLSICLSGRGLDAALSMSCISKLFRYLHASSTRSGVSKLMTPMVRWIDPTGRIALAGIVDSPESLGAVTSAAKRWIEAWSCGREEGVTRGRRRKWVSLGFGLGGIVGMGGPCVEKVSVYVAGREGII